MSWLVLTLGLSSHADMLVRVRAFVRAPEGSQVRLSQLCDVTEATPKATAELDAIVAATSPAKLTTPEVIQLLKPVVARARTEGVAVRLNLPALVEITAGRELKPDAVTTELIGLWQPTCADCRLEIENLTLPRVGPVRDWSLKGRPELPHGTFSVPVELTRADGVTLTAWISGRLKLNRAVPVATRLIQPGELLTAADFRVETRDVAQALDGTPPAAEVAGKRARRGLRVGDVLWTGALERERAVRRGEAVRLHATDGGWDVSLNVTAPQDASVGDVINFKNVKSGAVVVGQVTGPGEAELR